MCLRKFYVRRYNNKVDSIEAGKNEMSIASDLILPLIFRKSPRSKRIKHKSWKKSAIYEGEHSPYSEKEAEWTERKQEYISVWENPLCNIRFLLITFSRISYTGLHLRLSLSDVNQTWIFYMNKPHFTIYC